MNKNKYISKSELEQLYKVGLCGGEFEIIAKKTEDKTWKRKLKTMSTMCKNITDERLACIDKVQLPSVARRIKNSEIIIVTTDKQRFLEKQETEETAQFKVEHINDIVELALNSCRACDQKNKHQCKYRQAMHSVGIPVARENVKENECEFKLDNRIVFIKNDTPKAV